MPAKKRLRKLPPLRPLPSRVVYQLCAFGKCQESLIYSLADARRMKRDFIKRGAKDVEIARYDRNGTYFEVIE